MVTTQTRGGEGAQAAVEEVMGTGEVMEREGDITKVMVPDLTTTGRMDMVEVEVADQKEEEGTTLSLEVMGADLGKAREGRMALLAAGEGSRGIKVEGVVTINLEREVFRTGEVEEEAIKTEVVVTNVHILVHGALVQLLDLRGGALCPQDTTDKVPVTDKVLEVVDITLGVHLLLGAMTGALHPQ